MARFELRPGFLLLLGIVTQYMHMDGQAEGPQSSLARTTRLIPAVKLHNILDGMAVGVVFDGGLEPDKRSRSDYPNYAQRIPLCVVVYKSAGMHLL